QVAQRAVAAKLIGRMRICHDTLGYFLGPGAAAPYLRPAEEKALIRRKAINLLIALTLLRLLKGFVSDSHASEVGEILALGKMAVYMHGIKHSVIVELINNHVGALHKIRRVGGGPPVLQIAVGIVLAPLIIESVGHLMTDDRTDSAIIHRIIRLVVEEGILEDACREHDLI